MANILGQQKYSLWSIDMFLAESILLQSHWIMLVMDQFSRKIIGYAVVKTKGLTGWNVCFMFNKVMGAKPPLKRMSNDRYPLFRLHRWVENMEMLDIEEIRSVPFTPTSHPFVERATGTTRREFLDKTLFWNEVDLATKL